jgi:predicted DNA-binding transcriptional regulator AlpA
MSTPLSQQRLILLTDKDLQQETGIPAWTLRKWRSQRKGPPFIRLGRRTRYARTDVERWLAEMPRHGGSD